MQKIILVSHGLAAEGMKNSVEMISGKHDNLYAFGLKESNSTKDIIKKINNMMEVDVESQYIIISDFPGGSVNTEMISLISKKNVHLVSGMNLMLCLEILLAPKNLQIEKIIENALDSARKTLVDMKSISFQKNDEEDYFDD